LTISRLREKRGAMLRFEPDLPFETDRLYLRGFEMGDLEALSAIYGRSEVARYLYWEPRSPAETREMLEKKVSQRHLDEDGDTLSLALVAKASGQLVGDCILVATSVEHRQGEIGFILDPVHQGHGYATEAARELLRVAFQDLGLHRVVGRLEARNAKSAKVLERLGMRQEAHLIESEFVKGEWQSEAIFALLQREWAREKP
jgi:RimJ/RimL family protein N-acetyltransferase